MSLKALELIKSVKYIITDRLVSREIIDLIPPHAQVLFTHKTCGNAQEAQDEINNWILTGLEFGNVLRLKGGDPFVFGRGGEEWNLVLNNTKDCKVEWIPGISSSISAAGAAGIPVTHRGIADSFIVCTGQKRDGSWGSIARYSKSRTLVLLMAIGGVDELESMLLGLGYPQESRVAVIHKATLNDQIVVRGSLNDFAIQVKQAGIKNHATIIVGDVVDCLVRQY